MRGEGGATPAPEHVPCSVSPRSACLLDRWDQVRQGLACARSGLADDILMRQSWWDGCCLHICAGLILHDLCQCPAYHTPDENPLTLVGVLDTNLEPAMPNAMFSL